MNPHRALLVFVVGLFIAATASAEDAAKPTAEVEFSVTPLILDGLLDASAPIEHRRDLAKQLVDAADREKSPTLLYYVGTLYRQGDAAGIAPFPRDLDRAREYLTRAALAGEVVAMSKLAVVELDSGNHFEPNLWAQLFIHYAAIGETAKPADPHTPRQPTGSESLGSALLARTMDGFPKSEIPRLVDRANVMVARYDTVIRSHLAKARAEQEKSWVPRMSARKPIHLTPMQMGNQLGRKAASAEAEYFAEFDADGKLLRVWPFDGWPEQKVMRVLRPIVNGFVLDRTTDSETAKRIVLIPVRFMNPAYRLEKKDDKN